MCTLLRVVKVCVYACVYANANEGMIVKERQETAAVKVQGISEGYKSSTIWLVV